MERISEILKKKTPTSTAGKSTATSSSTEAEASPEGVCPVCRGAGIVHPQEASGKPDYSRVVPCRCTHKELEKERLERLQRYSGLEPELLKKMTFGNFGKRVNLSPELQEHLERALKEAMEFAKSPKDWLVFQGVTGSGKTHLAAAIANYRLKEGKPVKFVVVPDLLDHLRSTFSPESPVSYDQLFEEVKSAPLLILDDFGEQSTTPWAQEKLYQIINFRYNSRLPTVVTTRLTTEQMDGPIASRFLDFQLSMIFSLMVPDYRTDATSRKPKPRPASRWRRT